MFTPKPYLAFCFLLIVSIVNAQSDVLQQHNDLNRTGWNPHETILNTSNVTPTNFGILYKHTVDDQIYAQPLIVTGIQVTDPKTNAQVTKNLLIVVTVKNTMYAFDADDGTLDPYWQKNFTPAGEVVPYAADVHSAPCDFTYTDFQSSGNGYGQLGAFGTVGTPVIDKSTNTIYFVTRYRDPTVDNTAPNSSPQYSESPGWSSAGFYEQVHALNISTGADKFGSPVLIDPTTTFVNGTGDGNVGNKIYFDPRRQNPRTGLFISNGIVYISFSSHCDMDNYHGWILGYKTNDLSQQLIRYVTTPNDGRGGIWMCGAAPAVDAAGNIYFAVGNGTNASQASDPGNVALSVVKASPDLANNTLTNVSWYKPGSSTYNAWNASDLDFGTSVVLIPGSNMLVTAHKSGKLFLLPQNIPAPGGEYSDGSPYFLASYDLGVGGNAQFHTSLTYFGGATNQYIYQFSENSHLSAFPVNFAAQTLGPQIQNTSVPVNASLKGGYSSVSSNGTDPSTAILWVTQLTGNSGGTMHALKADDITQELWNSDANPVDVLGDYAKMSPPTIANGKVYVATFTNTLNVYGLLANNSRCINNIALNKHVSSSTNTDPSNPAANATDGNTATRWGINGGTKSFIFVDLGSRYDICKISVLWDNINDNAHAFTIDITDDTLGTWTTINADANNIFTDNNQVLANTYNENVTARYVRVNATTGGVYGTSITELQVYGSPANNCVSPKLATTPVSNITENSATLNWIPVHGITNYIVKYKPQTIASFITRNVQDLSGGTNPLNLNITGLACSTGYDFDILSDCGNSQTSTPSLKNFQTITCSSPCAGLTRWSNADLGDVLTAGTSCYSEPYANDQIFTLTGSGTGLGGNGDQFQFNYASLQTDQDFIARIATQDATPASNQAGVMMRDSLTDISRYMFIGKTGDNRIAFIYRTTPGGTAVGSYFANITNADFFRVLKAGTQYSAFYGNSITGPWTPAAPAVDLGFGTQPLYVGMAVSGFNGTSSSTASFTDFDGSSAPLPIQLLNFTATNEQDKDVKLTWQTANEENNDHFEVERGIDPTSFEKILTVKGVGNSTVTQSYSAIDNSPVRGVNYYRLKQVDTDGKYTYSNVVTVKFGVGDDPVVYPNPIVSVFTAVPGKELIREIVIYNVQGRAVQFAIGNSTEAPMNVNISLLSTGLYFLKVKTDSKIYQFKIIKQ